MRTLVLGGARSGKSALAQRLAQAHAMPVTFVATATASDAEMADRIARHQRERPSDWALVEEPVALGRVLREHAGDGRCVLVDCMTLWLGNLMLLEDDARLAAEREALLDALAAAGGEVILVSNEIGMGVVPEHAVSRWFRDTLGELHQALAQRCDAAALCVAGLPLWLKGPAAG